MTVALLAIGLVAAGAGTMVFLRNALDANLDAQVQQLALADVAKSAFEITVSGDDVTFTPNSSTSIGFSGYYVAVYAADGVKLASVGPRSENQPVFPATMAARQTTIQGTAPLTIAGSTGVPFRGSASLFQIESRSALYTQLVALPTSTVSRVVGTFLGIYSILAALIIVIGALVTRLLVTLAFRSLGQVESTAMSIAAGDFSQRMSKIEPEHTEVGRLKIAINAMLARLDAAIGQRDAAVRQMRRFIGDASHELRTPLVTVRGYAELYRMGAIGTDEEVAQSMERIEKEAIRMGVLVEDLLALTRLDEHREEVPMLPVDLRPIARDAALDVRAASPRRQVTVEDTTSSLPGNLLPALLVPQTSPTATLRHRAQSGHSRATGPLSLLRRRSRPAASEADAPQPAPVAAPGPAVAQPIVLGEENRIRQVVTNLLANARRYTPDDSPIELYLGADAATGTGWIAIADHGDGIPPQIRDQIFQRFWRADTSRTRETGGSGLGLSIVASIVETLHGSVTVADTPGGGATFRVAFPLAHARDEHLLIQTQPLKPPRPHAGDDAH
ncbi:hypothetical protein GCM10022240_10930 [Microbacterium kribbense]|uniref:histidine kinase n=1 Tax=Microbacterium kribbense TaxID=433645 RepID=A0ABP7GC77_9MICO